VRVETVSEVVAGRVAGERPSRLKSFVVATAVGFTAAAVTYRLLRSAAESTEGR
jgi:hypothetical protein